MTPRELVLEQIHHRETRPVPYSLGFEGDVPQQLDKHYGSPDWRKRLTTYMRTAGGVDTVRERSIGESRGRDAFGTVWRYDRTPPHIEEPALKRPSFDGCSFPEPEVFRNPDVGEIVHKLKAGEYADTFNIIYIGWGLFEQSWRIRGFENAMMDSVLEPDFYAELIERLTRLYLAHVEQWADAPADAIMFGDDWGEQRGVTLGPERWRRFIKPGWARIYDAVHRQGKLVITHCCGSVAEIMPDIIEMGLDVLESVQPEAAGMNPYELKRAWGDKITFWGCLGSQSTTAFGTPAEIHSEVRRLCKEMGKGGGYILAPAKGLQPGTPVENAVACIDAFTNQR